MAKQPSTANLSGNQTANPTGPDMPAITLGKLATMYGLHRSSVYEAVSKGRVSAGVNRQGQKVVELSEAIRVWGEPVGSPTAKPDSQTPLPDAPDSNAELIAELRLLRQEVAELRQTMLLIEHRPDRPTPPEPAPPPVEQPPNEFADIFDSLKARH